MEKEKLLKYILIVITMSLVVNIYSAFMLKNLQRDIGYIKGGVGEMFYKVMRQY